MNSEAAQLSETSLATPVVSDEPADAGGMVPPESPPHETLPESATEAAPTPESASELAAQHPRHLLKTLQMQFPAFRDCLPLSIGIDKAIKLALPEVNKKALRIALSLHTHGNRYLRGMAKATERFNLDGSPAGEVTEEHRQHAADTLRERMKKQADERRAAQKAEREQQKTGRPPQTAKREQARREQPQGERPKREHAKPEREQPKAEHPAEHPADAGRTTAEKLALLAQKFARH